TPFFTDIFYRKLRGNHRASHGILPSMKSLKLDHELAALVMLGKKRSTWRLFDDKDLSVNDEVRLIDKVDKNRPETWKAIGTARINMVIQKRLGDIDPNDYDDHERYESKQQMLEVFRSRYGNDVNFDTIVKIVRFDFDSNQKGIEDNDA